jgi:hypothetical protein
VQIFYGSKVSTTNNSVQSWNKPVGVSHVYMMLIGAGGSGTVILAFPNALYPAINSPTATVTTPPAAPGSTVLTYTTPSPGIPTSHVIAVNNPGAFATQYLVVGGGGAGGRPGNPGGGGGGAGGLLQGNILLVAGTTYTIQVGGGGVAMAVAVVTYRMYPKEKMSGTTGIMMYRSMTLPT